jgi:Ca2+-binding RTX toxin-like protein
VKKQFVLLVLGLVGVLVVSGQIARAAAGPGANDIQDSLPAWAPDGVHVAFERTAPDLESVLVMTSAGKDTYFAFFTGQVRGYLGSKLLIQSGPSTLATVGGRFAGAPTVLPGTDASASPDAAHVAYVRAGGLYVANADGSDERRVATAVVVPPGDVIGPAWSPDGTRIAVATGGGLVLASTDGSGSRVITHGDDSNPSWSSAGTSIAYQQRDGSYDAIWTVNADGTGAHALISGDANYRFPQYARYANQLAYTSDRQKLRGGATQYQLALWLRDSSGIDHKLVDDVHPYSPPRWSITAALIAVSAGQECRRWGVYVVSPSGGTPHRHSNLCRVTGTPRADRLGGSNYFDLIRGLGGNDTILARGGSDRIEGNDGNDLIEAAGGNDVVFGGSGNDRILGGAGNDLIIGGNGRDTIDCGTGDDTVEGAGPLDRIARDCEHVRR